MASKQALAHGLEEVEWRIQLYIRRTYERATAPRRAAKCVYPTLIPYVRQLRTRTYNTRLWITDKARALGWICHAYGVRIWPAAGWSVALDRPRSGSSFPAVRASP